MLMSPQINCFADVAKINMWMQKGLLKIPKHASFEDLIQFLTV